MSEDYYGRRQVKEQPSADDYAAARHREEMSRAPKTLPNPWWRKDGITNGREFVSVEWIENRVRSYERHEPEGRRAATAAAREALQQYESELPAKRAREAETRATVDALLEPKWAGDQWTDESVTAGRHRARVEWDAAALALDRTQSTIAALKAEVAAQKRPSPGNEPVELKWARRLLAEYHAPAANDNGNGSNGHG